MNKLLEAALKYARLGWHVFPIRPGRKDPFPGTHGCKDATTDGNHIKAWWTTWPDANIAVACGKASGIYVVDVDVREGVDGYDSLKEFQLLPSTVIQSTPSGGSHAFYRTDDPPANRNNFLPGVDIRGDGYYVLLAPSVHPNGKQYEWLVHREPWTAKLAEYPDFLRPAKKLPSGVPSPSTPAPVPATFPTAECWRDKLDVAKRYLAQVDPAIQGLGGHDKLFWACGCMTWGCELPFDQAYNILASEYNPRCIPPWDLSDKREEHDFRRKIAESIKRPPDKPKGWILNDPAYAPAGPLAEMDIAKLIANASPTERFLEIHKEAILKHPIPSEDTIRFLTQPTGLLGELCSWINATSFRPQPYLTLGCALAFLGVLFGRKVKDTLGSRTNLYIISVALSSAGKNHGMDKIRELCLAADCLNLIGGSDLASDAGVENHLAEEPATIFLLDEIGHLLVNIKSGASKHQTQIISLLMRLYSSAKNVYLGRQYANKEEQRALIQPCCCLYGVTTPDKFAAGLSVSELSDGWLSRCLIFYVHGRPKKLRDTDLTAPPPQRLVELVSAWAKRTIEVPEDRKKVSQFVVGSADNFSKPPPEQIIVPTDAYAEQRFRDFDDMADKKALKEPRLAASWLKAEENARRIALIMGCSDNYDDPTITIEAADRACKMVKKIIEDFGRYIVPEITEGKTAAEKQKILNVIKGFGAKGCVKREVTRKTRWANVRQRNDLLADLIEGGEVVCGKTESGRGIRYLAVEVDDE